MTPRIKRNQRLLEFDGTKETRRQERVERILGDIPQVETAARYFTAAESKKATALARKATE